MDQKQILDLLAKMSSSSSSPSVTAARLAAAPTALQGFLQTQEVGTHAAG